MRHPIASVLLSLFLSAPLAWASSNAHAQGKTAAPAAKAKAYPYSLTPPQMRAAHDFLQGDAKRKAASTKLGKELQRLQRAHGALQTFPGNKRLIKRYHAQAAKAQGLANSFITLLASTSAGKPPAPTAEGTNLQALSSEVWGYLKDVVALVHDKEETGLAEKELESLSAMQAAAKRNVDTLLAIVQPASSP